MGSDDEGESTIFGDERTKYVMQRIFSTYPKVTVGAKFDKAFMTEDNR